MSYILLGLGISYLLFLFTLIAVHFFVKAPQSRPTAKTVRPKGSDRHLAYEVRGDTNQPNCIIWLHGIASSRYEMSAIDEEAIRAARAFVICFDRPGYGESSLHMGRSFASGVEDVLTIADAFDVDKFFLVAVSGGGSYALAVASTVPERVRGMLLLSPGGPYHTVSTEAQNDEIRRAGGIFRRLARSQTWIMDLLLWHIETYVGGKSLWYLGLGYEMRNITRHLNRNDVRVAKLPPANHFDVVLPESLKQNIATPILQDVMLLRRPWSFDISKKIPQSLARATHIYHGAKDKMVLLEYAFVYKKKLPAVSLEVVADGHHFDYWVGDVQRQSEMLQRLIGTGLPA